MHARLGSDFLFGSALIEGLRVPLLQVPSRMPDVSRAAQASGSSSGWAQDLATCWTVCSGSRHICTKTQRVDVHQHAPVRRGSVGLAGGQTDISAALAGRKPACVNGVAAPHYCMPLRPRVSAQACLRLRQRQLTTSKTQGRGARWVLTRLAGWLLSGRPLNHNCH